MFIKLYLIALPIFFLFDLVWLGLVAKNFYAKQIGFLLRPDVNWLAAIIFYLLFLVGLVIFVILPAMEKNSLLTAIFLGALFGLVTYATYDLTNLALTKNWPLLVTIVDLLWGTFISALVSGATFFLFIKLFN